MYSFALWVKQKYDEAMTKYGNDKPDIRFGMEFGELNQVAQNKDFNVFNAAELVVGIAVPGAATYTRKEIDALVDWVRRPQIGAKGMVYVKCNEDGTFKSSVDKFYDQEDLSNWAKATNAKAGDLISNIYSAFKKRLFNRARKRPQNARYHLRQDNFPTEPQLF